MGLIIQLVRIFNPLVPSAIGWLAYLFGPNRIVIENTQFEFM